MANEPIAAPPPTPPAPPPGTPVPTPIQLNVNPPNPMNPTLAPLPTNPEPQPVPGAPIVPPVEGPPAPQYLINEKGEFVENWHHYAAEGQYKDDPTLSNFKTLDGLIGSHLSQRSMLGKNNIARPDENSGADVWEKFYRAGGWPEKSDGYNIQANGLPEGFEINVEAEKGLLEFAHASKYNHAQAQDLINFMRQGQVDGRAADIAADNQASTQAEAVLRDKWGTNLEGNIDMANKAMKMANVSELVGDLNLAQDPRMVELLYEMAISVQEDKLGDLGEGTEVVNAQEKLAQVMADPDYLDNYNNPARHNQLVDEALRLRTVVSGNGSAQGYKSSMRLDVPGG